MNGSYEGEGIKVLARACGGGIERLRKLFFLDARGQSDSGCHRHMERGVRCGLDDADNYADDQL